MTGPAARNALLRWSVPALYLAGIVATFLREVVLAATYGTSTEIEVFRIAFAVPNMLSTSLGPAFVAAVVPALMRAERGEGDVPATERDVTAINVAGVFALSVAGIVSAPLQARLLAPGYGPELVSDLTVQIALMWLFFAAAGCSFSLRAMLSRRGVLWPAAGATVVTSGMLALGCLLVGRFVPGGSVPPAGLLTALAVVSGVLVLCMHVWVLPSESRSALRLRAADLPGVAWAARSLGGAVLLVGIFHFLSAVPRLIDRAMATTLESGAVAALEYSFSLITVPGILLGTSLVTMLYPGFARSVEAGDTQPVVQLVRPVLVSLGLAATAGICMSVLAPLIVDVVFARGSFGPDAAALTTEFLRWHAIALPLMVATIILAQAALAFRAYGLVLLVALARILAKWLGVAWLVPDHGLTGLAASFIIPEAVSTVLLVILLRGKLRGAARVEAS